MITFWRWAVRLVALFLVVLVLAVAAVRFLLPAERLVDAAVSRVERATGAEVELGRISLRFWPRLHMLVEGGRIRGSGRDGTVAAFSLTWRRLAVSLSWTGLLRRRVEVGRVELDGPVMTLVAAADARSRDRGEVAPPPVAVALAGVTVRDGILHWRGPDRRLDLYGWRQDVDLDLRRRGSVLAAGDLRRLALRARVDSLRWRASGDTIGLRLTDVAADLVLRPDTDGPTSWRWDLRSLRLPGVALAAAGQWRPDGGAAGRLTGEGTLRDWDPRVLPHLLAGFVATHRPATAAWLRRQDWTGADLTASFAVDTRLPPPPTPPGVPPAGLTLTARCRELPLVPLHHRDRWLADAAVAVADGRVSVTVDRLTPAEGGGAVTGALVRTPRGDGIASHLDLAWRDVSLPALMRWGPGRPDRFVAGTGDGRLVLAWRGDEPDSLRASLDGEGRLRLRDGTLHLEEWLGSLQRYLGNRPDLLTVAVDSLATSLALVDGAVRVPDLVLDGPDTEWRGGGRIGLDGTLDLALRVRLPADLRPGGGVVGAAAALLRDEEGRITLPLRLTGRLAAPAVTVELAPATDRLRDGVRGWLDKLRGNQ